MLERAPNGFFIRDMMIFNHLRRGGYVSKGFIFEAPDLQNSPAADLTISQDKTCLLVASLHEHQREIVLILEIVEIGCRTVRKVGRLKDETLRDVAAAPEMIEDHHVADEK